MLIRIRIHLGPWIRIQGYNMKKKAEFNQQIFFFLGLLKDGLSWIRIRIYQIL